MLVFGQFLLERQMNFLLDVWKLEGTRLTLENG